MAAVAGRKNLRETLEYRVLISACLAGLCTRYDGGSTPHPSLNVLGARNLIIPVCPEILGGLGIPRPPCRLSGGDGRMVLRGEARVINRNGEDRTSHFLRGADETRRIIDLVAPDFVILKEGSPSCGVRRVDIEGKKQPGCGVTTALLLDMGMTMLSEEDPLPTGL